MATVVIHANLTAPRGTVAEMHADRKRVLVDRRRRDALLPGSRHEIDEFDTEDTVYLVAQDPLTGGHLGSVRLLRSTGPHPLRDSFAQLCSAPVPRGAATWDITRMCAAPALPRGAAEHARECLSVALLEFALARGINHYTMTTPLTLLPAVLAVGWECTPLGLPARIGGEMAAALLLTVDPATLGACREKWDLPQLVLRLVPTESELVA